MDTITIGLSVCLGYLMGFLAGCVWCNYKQGKKEAKNEFTKRQEKRTEV